MLTEFLQILGIEWKLEKEQSGRSCTYLGNCFKFYILLKYKIIRDNNRLSQIREYPNADIKET